ncbi:SRPBCC family protein [Kitasatospora sp. NPDC048540]|uniref:SRPBCC family protein n=1 Tax=unclassified Kitasatospora TaxID=2633591 RepID=UPI00053A4900|nr:SRPBCC family protein [Kitasatospora sp. MBT63]
MPAITAQVFVQAPLQNVFAFLANARNLPLWSSAVIEVDGADVVPAYGAVYRYRFPGRHHDSRLLCSAASRPYEVAFRGGRMWTPLGWQIPELVFHLCDEADGVRVEIEVVSRLGGAMLLFWPHLAVAWRRDLRRDACRLAAVLAGQDPEGENGAVEVVTHVRRPGERRRVR